MACPTHATASPLTVGVHDRVTSLLPWEDYMNDFVAMLQNKGCPFDGMIGMVDGHFQACCRPGGLGCINDNVFDYQMFNGAALQPARPCARSWRAKLEARFLP